jgi:hypothetical protein
MCVIIMDGETIASGLTHSAAVREAKVAARLFGAGITVFNLKTKEIVEWTK